MEPQSTGASGAGEFEFGRCRIEGLDMQLGQLRGLGRCEIQPVRSGAAALQKVRIGIGNFLLDDNGCVQGNGCREGASGAWNCGSAASWLFKLTPSGADSAGTHAASVCDA
jgi:hypothetical protein